MKRRNFIQNTALAAALLPLTSLAGCTPATPLHQIIHQKAALLKQFPYQGYADCQYFILSKGSFSHPSIKGREALVFCREGQVQSYTIHGDEVDEFDHLKASLVQQYGAPTASWQNLYGESHSWQNEHTQISLCVSNGRKDTPPGLYYTEAAAEGPVLT